MAARLEPSGDRRHRCGWPFRIVNSTTVVHCTLPLGHDGPLCELRDPDGTLRAAVPRFGAEGAPA